MKSIFRKFVVSLISTLLIAGYVNAENSPAIDLPPIVLKNVGFTLTVQNIPDSSRVFLTGQNVLIGDSGQQTIIASGSHEFSNIVFNTLGSQSLTYEINGSTYTEQIEVLPGILSIIPPLLAILMALLTKQIIVSLFVGTFIGVFFVQDFAFFQSLLMLLDTYVVEAIMDSSHASIIVFTMAFGGMVGVLAKNGGMQGIVNKISNFASSNRNGQMSTIFMGMLIFFDDYANTLLVGNTMRVLTDKLRISREKLSYLVDSTAAPVTSIAIISTWVGFEIGLMQEAFESVGMEANVYLVFIETIPYRFYSLFALLFVFLIAYTQRDYGPMLQAERRSVKEGDVLGENARPLTDTSELEIPEGIPYRWYNAIVPILTVIVTMLFGLYFSGVSSLPEGSSRRLWEVIGASDSFEVLIWASFAGSIVAIIMSAWQKILPLPDAIDAWLSGVKAMVLAIVVLILAWTLSRICGEVQTAEYIIARTQGILQPEFLPMLSFITAAVISFATGTSWGTMAILIPIVIPLMAQLLANQGVETVVNAESFLAAFASVLSGSVFGDHCSPISDTTILSSMASGADHIDHVKTQIPYALAVGTVAILFGYLPAGYHLNWFLFFGIGVALLVGVVLLFGKPISAREDIELE
ncbi:MAG: Na+/H+ antiporter NhaC family protein [Candidatus Marinimicrobia bacterium]|nr:Na+/H+ antiporter NhaC family protein [Candidatus Neomarinimicrobiota bacterium]